MQTKQRALIADTEQKLQQLLDVVVKESERKGLESNKKSCVMVFSKKENKPTCNTKVK